MCCLVSSRTAKNERGTSGPRLEPRPPAAKSPFAVCYELPDSYLFSTGAELLRFCYGRPWRRLAGTRNRCHFQIRVQGSFNCWLFLTAACQTKVQGQD